MVSSRRGNSADSRDDYAPDGSEISNATLVLEVGGAELRYKVEGTGTWKLRGSKLCETVGRTSVMPANQAAATSQAEPILKAFRKLFAERMAKGTASCVRIIELTPRRLVTQDPDDNNVTTCTR